MNRSSGLGRGLDSLLKPSQREELSNHAQENAVHKKTGTPSNRSQAFNQQIALDRIYPNTNQPRRQFDQESLEQLSESVRSQGVIQPIIVRSVGNRFEIIAGERRWRAAKLAGIQTIPVVIRDDLNEQTTLAVALIENLQRENLNVIEEAEAIRKLVDNHHLTHEEISKSLGKSRSAITNSLRLLDLEAGVKQKVREGLLKMGHVRPLLTLEAGQQSALADRIIEKKLSARQTEEAIKQLNDPKEPQTKPSSIDENIAEMQRQVRLDTALNIHIKQRKNGSGEIVIPYENLDLLTSLINRYFK